MKEVVYFILSIIFIAFIGVVIFFIKPDSSDFAGNKNDQVLTEVMDTSSIKEHETYLSNISINYLKSLDIDSKKPNIEEELEDGVNYKRYIASYVSEGNTVYGLLTIPNQEPPEGGFKAIIFNHGYIPPKQYRTEEKYVAYVDYLARNGFVVFKIDMRGHGNSEGDPTGSYFSPAYTIDAISALKSLQKLDVVNANRIGMWGHSMAGNLVLRAMLVDEDIKASVIWAGAVYSYEDFSKYRLNDSSYVRRQNNEDNIQGDTKPQTYIEKEVSKLRSNPEEIDFSNDFWSSISLTGNLQYLNSPIQLHHDQNDVVVDIGYSRDLVSVLEKNGKSYEYFEYEGGGHNINSPYFEQAMQRTVDFFEAEL